jgi:type IV pilus assembly protein PilA
MEVHAIKGLARRDDERGFTLIELMVVVLIIAILIAIAIPTFLGARQRAQDRASQSDLRNGLTAEKTFYTDNQTYGDATTLAGSSIETSLKWGTTLHVKLSTDTLSVCLDETSKSGTKFAIIDVSAGSTAGTYYGKTDCASVTVPASGGALPSGFGASW